MKKILRYAICVCLISFAACEELDESDLDYFDNQEDENIENIENNIDDTEQNINNNNNNNNNNDNNNNDNNNNDNNNNENNNDENNNENNNSENTINASAEEIAFFNYLTSVRENPSAFASEINEFMALCEKRAKLVWNDDLYKAAKHKADDMAQRGYFSHVDPDGYGMNYFINKYGYSLSQSFLEKPSDNYFESIAMGSALNTGKAACILLLNDKGADNDNAGHRRHLMGIDDFWENCVDFACACSKGEKGYYWSVLLAKHNF